MNGECLARAVENGIHRHAAFGRRFRPGEPGRDGTIQAQLAVVASDIGVWEWDVATGRVTWSPKCYEIAGTSPEDFDGTAVERGTRYEAEFRIVRPDGAIRWVANFGRAVYPGGGGAGRMIGTITDITERKVAEAALLNSEERYRLLFEGSALPMWEEDFSAVAVRFAELRAAGVHNFRAYLTAHPEELRRLAALVKLTDVNPASCALFGVADRQALLASLPFHFCDDSWVVLREEMIALAGGQLTFRSEAPLQRADGEVRVVSLHLSVAPGAERTLSRVLVSMLDITERKAAEESLVEAARQKDEFVAVLVHELRNPLAPIRTAVALLRARGPAEPLVSRCRDVIDRQAAQMTRLLDDLLDMSRLSRGRPSCRSTPPRNRFSSRRTVPA
jgi:PAS domain S-box-containing protein